ncbi:MAG: 2-hydroxyglutaryl-CoA dehydratase [Clostridia bacterium]|jgi:predicted CoA-substrate-specific enzyme activase|nr:2-hydroxyglutaryl-CoA dehydratase [Clostridia bacterium]
MEVFLGIDVGSVSTNLVIIDKKINVLESLYLRTKGQPIKVLQEGLQLLKEKLNSTMKIVGVGTTGSGRVLSGAIVGADVVKNEITAHAVAASTLVPDVRTIIEIGGQDSKIIILRNGIVSDFAMNTVCAAGTGSFLDQQAERLNIDISEFGTLALKAKNPVRIAGRCTVFAESDMIHKQQTGHNTEDIIAGLCEALVRNYLNNVGKGKEILPPVIFQGGVAANAGIKQAFEKQLGIEVQIPTHFGVMGAIGVGILAKNNYQATGRTQFKGFEISTADFTAGSFECDGCSNLCEIINIYQDGKIIARWGGRCGKWDQGIQ